jgi:hypothetical protein
MGQNVNLFPTSYQALQRGGYRRQRGTTAELLEAEYAALRTLATVLREDARREIAALSA